MIATPIISWWKLQFERLLPLPQCVCLQLRVVEHVRLCSMGCCLRACDHDRVGSVQDAWELFIDAINVITYIRQLLVTYQYSTSVKVSHLKLHASYPSSIMHTHVLTVATQIGARQKPLHLCS